MKRILVSMMLALVWHATARDLGTLYDDDLLKSWQSSFQEDLVWNFQNAILPKLTPEEKVRLRKVKIEVPLRGPRRDLFEFYASGNTVVLPALGLRFFGDISLAYAWLNENHYNVGTVQQYVGMIYHQETNRFPGGLYPRPLPALQIPADAKQNPRVVDLRDKTFTSGMIFILCHELGHVYYQHPGNSGVPMELSRANEAQADAFAIELMRRVGVIPAGAPIWFGTAACVEAHRVDFPDEGAWRNFLTESNSHPLTGDRLQSLATAIEAGANDFARTQDNPSRGIVLAQYLAGQIRTIGEVLTNEGVHLLFRSQSGTTTLPMLAPRRGTAFEVQAADETFSNEPFSGVFKCKFGSKSSSEGVDLRLILRRKGDKVTGEYSYGTAAGKISGTVEDQTTLLFNWQEGGFVGKGQFNWKDEAGFTGTWGNKQSRDDGGDWSGKCQ